MPPVTQPTLQDITSDRWDSLPPELKYALQRSDFDKSLQAISSYYKLDERAYQTLVREVMLVLFMFEPLSKLANALCKSISSISADDATSIVSELEMTTFFGAIDTLSLIETSKDFKALRGASTVPTPTAPPVSTPQIPEAPKDLREKLELRPEGISQTTTTSEGGVRPLTREEVLRSLAPARTMAKDIESLNVSQGQQIPPVSPH